MGRIVGLRVGLTVVGTTFFLELIVGALVIFIFCRGSVGLIVEGFGDGALLGWLEGLPDGWLLGALLG